MAQTQERARKRRAPPIVHMVGEYRAQTQGAIACDIEQVRRIQQINIALAGTTLAEFKLQGSPIARLIDQGKVRGEELMAVQDIELAFFALTSRLLIKPMVHERVDCGGHARDWPIRTAKAVGRYQAWANHWSIRAKRGDKTLAVVIAAVVDQRPFSQIEEEYGMRKHGKAAIVVVRALRDYAARAGWVDGRQASRWKAEAAGSFVVRACA